MKTIEDAVYIGTVPAGTVIKSFRGLMIAVHPDHPVKVIDANGIRDLPLTTPDYPGYEKLVSVEGSFLWLDGVLQRREPIR